MRKDSESFDEAVAAIGEEYAEVLRLLASH